MALKKDIILSNGFVANYIKISSVKIEHNCLEQTVLGNTSNYVAKKFEVKLAIYKNELSRQDKKPAEERIVHLSGNFSYNHDNILPEIYTLLKSTQLLFMAEDI